MPAGLEFGQPAEQVVALDMGDGGPQPAAAASSRSLAASPAGLRPPALTTTLMPRSRQVPSTSRIWARKETA